MTTQKPQNINPIYLPVQIREIDRIAINDFGIPSYTLMTKAGQFAFERALTHWPCTKRFIILCGAGNNGGDGYVVALTAKTKGIPVTCISLTDCDALSGDVKRAYDDATKLGVETLPYATNTFDQINAFGDDLVIIDALFGTGLCRQVDGYYKSVIEQANTLRKQGCKILSIDIPSGLDGTTGMPLGAAIKADVTTSFIANKLGLITGKGQYFCGVLELSDLDIPSTAFAHLHTSSKEHAIYSLDIGKALSTVPTRNAHAHKGDNGRSVLIGGNYGFSGAIMIAAQACARLGAGLNSVITLAEHCASIVLMQPEIMAHHGLPVISDATSQLAENELSVETASSLLKSADVIGIGPGLGQDNWALRWLEAVAPIETFKVYDADALNLIAKGTSTPAKADTNVFTPHPGEAARLLACTTAEIEANRLNAVRDLQRKFGGHIVLKGAGTLVCHPNGDVMVCVYGNPGMASGGMGDALTGMLCSLIAQFYKTMPMNDIVDLAVNLHAYAADQEALKHGERGLLATDLCQQARHLLNKRS